MTQIETNPSPSVEEKADGSSTARRDLMEERKREIFNLLQEKIRELREIEEKFQRLKTEMDEEKNKSDRADLGSETPRTHILTLPPSPREVFKLQGADLKSSLERIQETKGGMKETVPDGREGSEEGSEEEGSEEEGSEEEEEAPCAFVNLRGTFRGFQTCPRAAMEGHTYCELHEVISRHLRLESFQSPGNGVSPNRADRWNAFFEEGW